MQTIKNGRKRGCGSCGQSESYESLQLNQPLITGIAGFRLGTVLSIHHPAGGDSRPVWAMVELPLDKELAT
jgi:hypothetical protein